MAHHECLHRSAIQGAKNGDSACHEVHACGTEKNCHFKRNCKRARILSQHGSASWFLGPRVPSLAPPERGPYGNSGAHVFRAPNDGTSYLSGVQTFMRTPATGGIAVKQKSRQQRRLCFGAGVRFPEDAYTIGRLAFLRTKSPHSITREVSVSERPPISHRH